SIASADYRPSPGEFVHADRLAMPQAKAALRIVLKAPGGVPRNELPLASPRLFLRGDEIAAKLYEHLLTANIGTVVQPKTRPVEFMTIHRGLATVPLGFGEGEALLPTGDRSFEGYRLLHEFFALPQRFMFVELRELAPLLREATTDVIELVLLFDRAEPRLEGLVQASNLALFCTPAINLFPRTGDRVPLDPNNYEHLVVPDRMRPNDFEVHSVTRVVGHGDAGSDGGEFAPLYAPSRARGHRNMSYTVRRRARELKSDALERVQDPRAPYISSDVYLSLVDGDHG